MRRIIQVTSDGLRLTAEVAGRGPPLVHAHGLTSHRKILLQELRPLRRRYRLVTFDQWGHGESSPVHDPVLYDCRRMADDIAAVMDSLDIESAIVGGESMGAATALLFALANPARVKALLLTAPAFGDSPHAAPEGVRLMAERYARLGMKGFLRATEADLRSQGVLPGRAIRHVLRMQGAHEAHSMAVACETVIQWVIIDDLERFARIEVPVCILAWPDDPLHPLALARRLAAVLPNATVLKLPSQSHLFTDPEILGRSYRTFLEKVHL
jgi:pimeloyl-ACP methyl ester carboxylesterase